MYSQKRNCAALVPHSFMCLWAIYIFPGMVHIFSCSRIGRPIVGIYKSITDKWMRKLGLRLRSSFSGNICFKFLALCLCSAVSPISPPPPPPQLKPISGVIPCQKIQNLNIKETCNAPAGLPSGGPCVALSPPIFGPYQFLVYVQLS